MIRSEALRLLCLTPLATPDEIDAAYRRMRSRSAFARPDLDAAYRILAASAPDTFARTAVREGPPDEPPPASFRSTPHHSASQTPTGPRGDAPLREGTLLGGRYQVRGQIGRGGMGAVYAAFDRRSGEEVAVKVLLPGLTADPDARARFVREATTARNLSHPGIVRVHDLHAEGDVAYLTMELLSDGSTLRDEIVRRRDVALRFDPIEVIEIGRRLADALSAAHDAGVVHRDVKPENVWLAPDGSVKVMDFGVARLMRGSQLATTGLALGTAYYMAPEQLRAAGDVDHRADQYAVGVVLYELLTGELPQGAVQSPRRVRRGVPGGLSNAVMTALAGRPGDRFPHIRSFADALTVAEPSGSWKPVLAAAGGVAAAAALVAAGWAFRDGIRDAFRPGAPKPVAGPAGPAAPTGTDPRTLAELNARAKKAVASAVQIEHKLHEAEAEFEEHAKKLPPDLAETGEEDREKLCRAYAEEKRLHALVAAADESFLAAERLETKGLTDAAADKYADAIAKANTVLDWLAASQEGLKAIDAARARVAAARKTLGAAEPQLFTWADAELDRAPAALIAADPTAVSKIIEKVDAALAAAMKLVPDASLLRGEIDRERAGLPDGPLFDPSRAEQDKARREPDGL